MPIKKILVALLIIIVAVGGFVAGLVLLRQQQELREEAAVPGGQAEVKISPETGSYRVGDTIPVTVSFNPSNIAISGVAIRLKYPYTGTVPEVSVSSIEVNSAISSSGDWTCPTQSSRLQGGEVITDVACAYTKAEGFSANTDTLLASIVLKVDRAPSVSPLVVRFDNATSVITRVSDHRDTLLIPVSTGSYTIEGAGTQVSGTPTPTARITATPGQGVSTTPTSATKTPTPTSTTKGGEELPDAGVSYPTLFGVALGVLVIVGAALLAL